MKTKTKAKILSVLLITGFVLGNISPSTTHAMITSTPAISLNYENIELELNSAISYFEATSDRTHVDEIIKTISIQPVSLTRRELSELLKSIIILGGCYSTKIAALKKVHADKLDEQSIPKNMAIVDICNNFLRAFIELNGGNIVINDQDKTHSTLLHAAVMHHNNDAIRILLEHGAKADIENLEHQTPYSLVESFPTRFQVFEDRGESALDIFHKYGIYR